MKRNQSNKRTRAVKCEETFQSAAELRPKNSIQTKYLTYLRKYPVTIATGLAGTGKTYLPTRIACQMFKQNLIDKIILVRPASSASNSLGFFKGTKEEKMAEWIRPILSTLKEEFSPGELKHMMKEEVGSIEFVPLETAKGNSWKDAFIIVDEAEDCNLKELKTLLTRIGNNSTMAICGDISQVDIQTSGVGEFLKLRERSQILQESVKHIDFCDYDHIERSAVVRDIIMGWDQAEGLLEDAE